MHFTRLNDIMIHYKDQLIDEVLDLFSNEPWSPYQDFMLKSDLLRERGHLFFNLLIKALDSSVTSAVVNAVRSGTPSSGKKPGEHLTHRELEILSRLVDGQSDQQVADECHISKHTVRSHIKSMFRKLEVSSRSQAAVKAMQQKIIDK